MLFDLCFTLKTLESCYHVDKVIVSTKHVTYNIKFQFVYNKKTAKYTTIALMTASTEL